MRAFSAIALFAFTATAVAGDLDDIDRTVFGKDDPRTQDFAKMMPADARRRMQEANLRESKAFAAVTTKEQWEMCRDIRIKALRDSLGHFPEVSKAMRVEVTRKTECDGFVIHNLLYESRAGSWVAANLYLPAKPPEKMPGILIAHSHHGGKSGGELQDMGMTWARAGTAVLVPDQYGYGERRLHDFRTDKDFDKPYRVGRQDYFFRYNSNLQLAAVGESLMGRMAWDLMRGIDVLLKQVAIDKDRIILMGAVAGGGDPAGVAAALDARIACVVPFNFGGWQPESSALANPDRDFAWFGDGYWESTRGLKNGARDGFAHFAIVGSVAPRKVLYAHEFGWDAKLDPAWPRLQKIFDFYGATDSLRVAHGKGGVKGPGGAENSHCDHIGAVHRKMIHPALKDWFGMPIPEEYSKRRPGGELICWTEDAKKDLKPKKEYELLAALAKARLAMQTADVEKLESLGVRKPSSKSWTNRLGNIEPVTEPRVTEGKSEIVAGIKIERFALETDPGITVPVLLLFPKDAKGKVPVVAMVAQAGKAGLLKEHKGGIETLLKAGIAVTLVDVRGTGETQAGKPAERASGRTSISQTNLILGQPVLGSQLRDLRTVVRWLPTRDGIDGKKIAVWGETTREHNSPGIKVAVPLDHDERETSEPNGANLALLAGMFEEGVIAVIARGGLDSVDSMFAGPYLSIPHEAVFDSLPGKSDKPTLIDRSVDAQNRRVGDKPLSHADAAKWLVGKLSTSR